MSNRRRWHCGWAQSQGLTASAHIDASRNSPSASALPEQVHCRLSAPEAGHECLDHCRQLGRAFHRDLVATVDDHQPGP